MRLEYQVIEVEDAKFYFEPPGRFSRVEIAEMTKMPLGEQFGVILKYLRKVEGLQDWDGNEVTAEGLRTLNVPASVIGQVIGNWYVSTAKYLGLDLEAEEKNESGVGSSDSSKAPSTTPASNAETAPSSS